VEEMVYMTKSEDGADDLIRELFGDVIFTYTDLEATLDGILIPFLTKSGDTGHRITRNCWDHMTAYHKAHGYAEYNEKKFYDFYLAELLPIVPFALQAYRNDDIFTTDYTFKKIGANAEREDRVWYMPNEVRGVTIMRPEDY
jgi:hypothetical protein